MIRRRLPLVVFLIPLLACYWFPYWLQSNSSLNGWEQFSQFGSAYGALNALFSSLAFSAIVLTIIVQGRQHDEALRAVTEQTELMRVGAESAYRQQFVAAFFEWRAIYSESVASLTLAPEDSMDGHPITVTGRPCFSAYVSRIRTAHGYAQPSETPEHCIPSVRAGRADEAEPYRALHVLPQSCLSQLYRHFEIVYMLFTFLDDAAIEDKGNYIRLARNALDPWEQVLLLYRGLEYMDERGRYPGMTDEKLNRMKPLIERFHLLRSLHQGALLLPDDLYLVSDSASRNYHDPRLEDEEWAYSVKAHLRPARQAT